MFRYLIDSQKGGLLDAPPDLLGGELTCILLVNTVVRIAIVGCLPSDNSLMHLTESLLSKVWVSAVNIVLFGWLVAAHGRNFYAEHY